LLRRLEQRDPLMRGLELGRHKAELATELGDLGREITNEGVPLRLEWLSRLCVNSLFNRLYIV
jgi:hypothetical protein